MSGAVVSETRPSGQARNSIPEMTDQQLPSKCELKQNLLANFYLYGRKK